MLSYPADKTLSTNNYAIWEEFVLNQLTQYPKSGLAIVNNLKYTLTHPTINDYLPNVFPKMSKYSFRDNGELSADSKKDFRADILYYEKVLDHLQNEEAKVCSFLKSSLSEEALLKVKNNPLYIAAANKNDSFNLYGIIKDTYQCSNNFCIMSQQAKLYFNLEQGTLSFDEYKDKCLRAYKLFCYNFEDKVKPGYVSLNDLAVILFCRSLNNTYFQYPLDSLYTNITPGALPPFHEVIKIFEDYTTQKQTSISSDMKLVDTIVDSPLLMSHTTTSTSLTSTKLCEKCKKVKTTINPTKNIPNRLCKKCFELSKTANPKTVSITQESSHSSNSTAIPLSSITIQQAQEVLARAKDNLSKQAAALLNSNITNSILDDIIDPEDQYQHLLLSNTVRCYTVLSSSTSFLYDNCCTYSSTNTFEDLSNPRELKLPIRMDSSSGHSMYATHVGTIKNFLIPIDLYYCPSLAHKLISLGAIVRAGGTYRITQPTGNLEIYDSTNNLIDSSPILENNTWLCNLTNSSLTNQINSNTISNNNQLIFTKEMISRATLCKDLHCFLGHPTNNYLKEILKHGFLAMYTILIAKDVDLMQIYFGDCLQCIEAKMHHLHVPDNSISYPETQVGEKVFFDLQQLSVPSKGGNTQVTISTDSKSTFTVVTGSKTKTTPDILAVCFELVSMYRAQGHTIKSFSTDCENICKSLKFELGKVGIDITVTPPEAHCHKVERIIQELDCKVTATLCSLSFILPSSLLLYLKKYIANSMNLSYRSTSAGDSCCAYEEFYHSKPILPTKFPFLPFGATVLFQNTIGQRQRVANNTNHNLNNVPKSQVGINLGIDHLHPGCCVFYTPKSPVPLPRSNFTPIKLIPFGYQLQTPLQSVIPNVSLPLETILPSDTLNTNTTTNITSQPDNTTITTNLTETLSTSNTVLPTIPLVRPIRSHNPPLRYVNGTITSINSLCLLPNSSSQCTLKQSWTKFAEYFSDITPAVLKELKKMFITYSALEFVNYSNIPPIHNLFRLFGFITKKINPDGSYKGLGYRIVASSTKSNFLNEINNYAPTSDHNLFMLTIVAILAYAVKMNILSKFFLRQYDLPAAFLQAVDTSPTPSYGKLPSDLPEPYTNKYVKFNRCIYGTPQANAIFFEDHDNVLKALGYTTCPLDPCKYILIDHTEKTYLKLCVISTHVDDGGATGTDREQYEITLNALRRRYGIIEESLMTGYLGINMNLDQSLGSLHCDLDYYIQNLLRKCTATNIPPKNTPYPMNLFDSALDTTPIDLTTYQQVIGSLIFTLRVRGDINLAVVEAASHNATPTVSDLSKLLHLLGYLKANSSLGPTFYTTDGPILIAGVDVAFAVHPTGGSHISMSFRIGTHSAAFHVISFAQKTCVSLNPTHSEYFGISHCTELVELYRYYLEWLGFPQTSPTIIETDSDSSIFIGEANTFPKKSKNLIVKHRNVQLGILNGIIQLKYEPSSTNMNDLNAKPNAGPSFLLKRNKLMNLPVS